jgi:hypothetical protein
MKGDLAIAKWMDNVEAEWKTRRKEKADKFDVYTWLDYRHKLTSQDPSKKYEVLYLTSGTFLAACVIDKSNAPHFEIGGQKIKLNGFLVDTKAYYYQTNDESEAFYLGAILNSKVLDTLIKPLQSQGLWGPRDIHKKPLEFPIPRFSSSNKIHAKLSNLGRDASMKAKSVLPQYLADLKIDPASINPNAVGRLRTKIRNALEDEICRIDELVCEIFTRP